MAETDAFPSFENALTDQPLEPDVQPVRIRDVDEAPELDREAPGSLEEGWPHPYGSTRLNSRSPGRIADSKWKVLWSSELAAGLDPKLILQAGDRILAVGSADWELLDLAGRSIGRGRCSEGDVVLDPRGGRFFLTDQIEMVRAHSMADAGASFGMLTFGGEGFRQILLAPRGQSILAASYEYLDEPHSDYPPDSSAIEVYDLGDPIEVDEFGVLVSSVRRAALARNASLLVAAAGDDEVVFAIEDHIYVADWDLRIKSILEGSFKPVLVSLDEAGRIYLIVEREGSLALWVVTTKGERLLDMPFRPEIRSFDSPPIVGYDHRVYLLNGAIIKAISLNKRLLWEHTAEGRIAGAVVLADDHLLISAGSELLSLDPEGEAKVHNTFEETLSTAPVMSSDGRILVASSRNLFCLERSR